MMAAVSCGGDDNGGSTAPGIIIPESDATPPGVGLLVDPEFGENVAVGSDTANGATTIHRRTGKLSFLASGKDSESGVRRLDIWMTKTVTTCQAGGTCTQAGPGLAGQPRFEADFGAKNPGEETSETASNLQQLDVDTEVGPGQPPPGGTRTVKLEFWATAQNHLGGEAKTAVAAVTLRETG